MDTLLQIRQAIATLTKNTNKLSISIDKNVNARYKDNQDAVFDIAELSDENSTALEDIAELLDDLETRVSALEKKEG